MLVQIGSVSYRSGFVTKGRRNFDEPLGYPRGSLPDDHHRIERDRDSEEKRHRRETEPVVSLRRPSEQELKRLEERDGSGQEREVQGADEVGSRQVRGGLRHVVRRGIKRRARCRRKEEIGG